jgi:opacity protein-like surface antigen
MLFAQNSYVSTDSVLSVGVRVLDGGDRKNSIICQVKKGRVLYKYKPKEINEYGFKGGRVYVSREIQIGNSMKSVFLERLTKGGISLYYYKGQKEKVFFVEKATTPFAELPICDKDKRQSFNDILDTLTADCPNVSIAVKHARFNKLSLKKLLNRYNNCELKPFPRLRYGAILGIGASKLMIPSSALNQVLTQLEFGYSGGFSFGMFIDKPILVSDFSLHTELYYSQHGYSSNKHTENKDIDFVAGTSAVYLPVMIRYAMPYNKIRPFVNAGVNFSYNLTNENRLSMSDLNAGNRELVYEAGISLIPDKYVGYSFGSGIEYKITEKRSLFVELRYTIFLGVFVNTEMLNNSEINITTGINF